MSAMLLVMPFLALGSLTNSWGAWLQATGEAESKGVTMVFQPPKLGHNHNNYGYHGYTTQMRTMVLEDLPT